MITENTTIGDTVVNWYGETNRVVAATRGGAWWILENVATGQTSMARRITADTVVITATIEGGN